MSIVQAAIDPRYASSDPNAEVIYLTGRKGTTPVMLEITVSTKAVRTVLFKFATETTNYEMVDANALANMPPTAYPTAFTIDGVKYLLFVVPDSIHGSHFGLFEVESENSSTITFKLSHRWDFSAIRTWELSQMNSRTVQAYLLSPDFNPITNTLYFTVNLHDQYDWSPREFDAAYNKMAYAVLTGTTFGTPAYITGSADPFDASHFSDAIAKDPENFAVDHGHLDMMNPFEWSEGANTYHNGGRARFGRMYSTRNGSGKVFFSDLYASFPSQNVYDADGSTVRFTVSDAEVRATETRLGHTVGYVPFDNTFQFNDLYTADISGGVTTNLHKITSRFTGLKAGINYITHISDDGTTIYVAHADVYDALNNMLLTPQSAIDLTHIDAYQIPGWVGEIQIYKTTDGGATYSKKATITTNDVTFEN